MFSNNWLKGYSLIVSLTLVFIFIPVLPGAFSSMNGEEKGGDLTPGYETEAELITLADLEIGDRVVDSSWNWENRSQSCDKPVTWIIVAKDHYGPDTGITLLSEEVIDQVVFDNSTNRGSERGTGHWGDSGSDNATEGMRPWLNSTGIHSDEGFYNAFSENFKNNINTITLPNKTWDGELYSTEDKVFIPSAGELSGFSDGTSLYQYFSGKPDTYRIATWWSSNTNCDYITRTQHSDYIDNNYMIYHWGWVFWNL